MIPPHRKAPLPPLLVIAIGILAVSTASIFIRYAQNYAPSVVIAAYRMGISTLVLAPLAWWRYRPQLTSLTRRDAGLAVASGLLLAVHFASWISSLEYTSVISSVVLVTTTPLWVAIFSPFLLKEPVHRQALWGLALALLGTLIIAIGQGCDLSANGLVCQPFGEVMTGRATLGNGLALIGALAGAGYFMIGRKLREKMQVIPYITLVYGMAAVGLAALVILLRQPVTGFPPAAFLWFILLALVPQLLGHSSFNWALGYLPAAFVSITLLGEPVGSTLLAMILLRETPTVLEGFGAILILLGIYVASLGSQNPSTKSPTEA